MFSYFLAIIMIARTLAPAEALCRRALTMRHTETCHYLCPLLLFKRPRVNRAVRVYQLKAAGIGFSECWSQLQQVFILLLVQAQKQIHVLVRFTFYLNGSYRFPYRLCKGQLVAVGVS